ncbi:M23 family metallopeptidase [Boudabousia marimammalium]|uniref:M23ase beta-sheet core domain-containing protein n=1 Tax=Boudabousia marimammalium TaxID=156892 RepID=A0A1Q5PM88_9ACTO|nr:M23 family metallopeptidase [Boudabousia marimammalium]OKL48087.1 hypothetical protein BM477_06410 [Boudabousia marimammalium]
MFRKSLLSVTAVFAACALALVAPQVPELTTVQDFPGAAVSSDSAFPSAASQSAWTWGAPVAQADDLNDRRKAQERRRQQAKQELEDAHSAMEGVDTQLAQLYIKQKEIAAQIPIAVAEVEEANVSLAAAQRKEEAVATRLRAAEQELTGLKQSITEDKQKLDESQKAIGELVRRSYRGEVGSSPMALVLTNTSVKDISQLASAADTATVLQTRLTSQLESTLADNRAKENRQQALTSSVADLKAEAEAAVQEYQQALASKKQKADSLVNLHKENEAVEAQLSQQRQAFAASEQEAQKEIQAAQAQMAAIDREIQAREAAERAKAKKQNKPYIPDTLPSTGSGVWGKPLGRQMSIASPWGYRIHPVLGYRRLHTGVDLRSPTGEKQYAVHDGVVRSSGPYGSCGQTVTIEHGSFGGHRWMTRHCHLSARLVSTGQRVSRGQVIGLTGSTGRVTGPHVHFEIWKDGQSVNPIPYTGL